MRRLALPTFLIDIFTFPAWGRGVWCVWLRNWLYFRYTLWISVLWVFVEPLLYLFAIGYGLGHYVGEVEGQPYIEFFMPALMAASAMMVTFYESTYSSYTKLTRQKTLNTILLAPVMPSEVVLGEIAWAASKGLFSAVAVALVALSQGLIDTWNVLPALAIVGLMSWVFAAFGLLLTAWAKTYDWFIYAQTGLIMPMYLFSGTYFPLSVLPEPLERLSMALPLTHAVMAVRTLLAGEWHDSILMNAGLLFLMAVGFTNWAVARMEKKLVL